MQDQSQADEMLMALVEQALTLPEEQRQLYLRTACEGDSELFNQAWDYIDWEKRMDGFLLDPLYSPAPSPGERDPVFEPGQLVIGRFRIVREVAQGGMGIVWEAIDEKLERKVAIKCAKAGFGKQLPPEVRNAREISHRNVCKIFEIHTDGEIDFIVMEFLEGETLADRLRMPFEMQEQEEGHWCWAAVSASVDRYLNPAAALTQCAIASEVLEAKNCCYNKDAHDEAASLKEALDVVKRLKTAKGGPLEFQELQSELDADRPVCVAIEWNGGGAHFVAVSGYQVSNSGIRTIEIGDPLYPNSTQDFDLFPSYYHGGGNWAATFLTQK